jgi:hypothetical protein
MFTSLSLFLTFVYSAFARTMRESGDKNWLTPTRPHLDPVVSTEEKPEDPDHDGFQCPYYAGYDMSSICYSVVETGELGNPAQEDNRIVTGSVAFPSDI